MMLSRLSLATDVCSCLNVSFSFFISCMTCVISLLILCSCLCSICKKVLPSNSEHVGLCFQSKWRHIFRNSLQSALTLSGIVIFPSAILNRQAISFRSSKGGLPDTNSIAKQPTDHISHLLPYSSELMTSGAQYHGVPTVDLLLIGSLEISTAVPKSMTLSTPSLLISTLSGFKSL
uniref:Uncharacterized protein n=1 Tax=Arcella intermedia TaxID=1963864 RepID=A0A6B2LLQ6_9EUKA